MHAQADRAAAYRWLEDTLPAGRLRYATLRKVDKGTVRAYLEKVTGLSRAQVTRLIGQFLRSGKVRDRRGPPARPFLRQYTPADIRLLAATDALHEQPACLCVARRQAVRKLCERAFAIFGDADYERLARISSSHIYNLRKSTGYRPACRQAGASDKSSRRPDPPQSRSASDASPGPRAGPDSCASTASTRAISTVSRACTTSTPSTRSRNGRASSASRRSASASWCPTSKPSS